MNGIVDGALIVILYIDYWYENEEGVSSSMYKEGIESFATRRLDDDALKLTFVVARVMDAEIAISEKLLSPDFFELSDSEEKSITARAELIEEGINRREKKPDTIHLPNRADARVMRRELSDHNREQHDRLTSILEGTYIRLAERIGNYVVGHQVELQEWCRALQPDRIEYSVAALPPNLFEHCPDGRPFIPQTNGAIADLVARYTLYSNKLLGRNMETLRTFNKGSETNDLAEELRRRRDRGDKLFETPEGQKTWRRYNRRFRMAMVSYPTTRFQKNAAFTNYAANYDFTEAGGFFEKTDGAFTSYYLLDVEESNSWFTSQVRAPIGACYGESAARSLAGGMRLMMRLIANDPTFANEAATLGRNPELGPFLKQHLTRAKEYLITIERDDVNVVKHGIVQTAMEAAASIGAVFSTIEADGIPGHENDVWSGMDAAIKSLVPLQLTRIAPPAVTVPPTIYGAYFRHMLTSSDGKLLLRPEVKSAWQEIQDVRTMATHAAWFDGVTNSGLNAPVRFGLGCPFYGVAQAFAECLAVCRAVAADHGL